MNFSKLPFYNAHGILPYSLTNDYMFRAILQQNNIVLKGLICSLLHLSPKQIHSVVIQNPIELGKAIDAKTFILDIEVILNSNTLINLEMQVINHGFWPERSLNYLCRSFDSLNKGENYSSVKPVIHISFLDFTLFPDHPEFYSTYMLKNIKNDTFYSDKFRLSVVNLNQIELASDEDKKYHIDNWAKLFKATTWEEIKMLASKNEYIEKASESLFELSAEDDIRRQCEAREEYYRLERTIQSEHKQLLNSLQIAEHNLKDIKSKLSDTKSELFNAQNKLSTTQNELSATQSELSTAQNELSTAQNELSTTQNKLTTTQNELDTIKQENEQLKAQLQAIHMQTP